ncbi:hypothetical protein [Jeotgalibacillus sp. R-1-5s-1]|uniref:hypothetical protein n=1 Tax=Jeotgalibacillus sp. R-1-5s-1 TaxID=2555897 RepID=UPI00141BDB65|nr:hypothetical protein [Jeotgalibacillus sp. R-1-5s-1]
MLKKTSSKKKRNDSESLSGDFRAWAIGEAVIQVILFVPRLIITFIRFLVP